MAGANELPKWMAPPWNVASLPMKAASSIVTSEVERNPPPSAVLPPWIDRPRSTRRLSTAITVFRTRSSVVCTRVVAAGPAPMISRSSSTSRSPVALAFSPAPAIDSCKGRPGVAGNRMRSGPARLFASVTASRKEQSPCVQPFGIGSPSTSTVMSIAKTGVTASSSIGSNKVGRPRQTGRRSTSGFRFGNVFIGQSQRQRVPVAFPYEKAGAKGTPNRNGV